MIGAFRPYLWRKGGLIALYILTIFGISGVAWAQSGGAYSIVRFSIDGGASRVNGGTYSLRGTIGQPEGVFASGGLYELRGGVSKLPVAGSLTPSLPAASPGLIYYVSGNVPLRWNRVSWAVGYWVQVARDKNFTNVVFSDDTLDPTTFSRVTTTLPGNGTYYWRVRAKINSTTWTLTWSVPEMFVVQVP
jgi:hypothetical protein